jgi:hypothetical protein
LTKREIVVVTAVSDLASRTLAASRVDGDLPVEELPILRGAIVLYSQPYIPNLATEVGRYRPIDNGKIAVEGPTVQPTS